VFELRAGRRSISRCLYRILDVDHGGTGPLEIDHGGTGPLEIDHGGTGPLEIDHGGTGPLEIDQGGTGPLEIDHGGTGPLEIDHGGTGPLEIASVAWDIVNAFSPIALVSTSRTNTTTINHLFMNPSE
jgi:hypothetical protein